MDGADRQSHALDVAALNDATLGLVEAAERGQAGAVLRTLVRTVVGLGFSEGATVWTWAEEERAWRRTVHFGETTATPSELGTSARALPLHGSAQLIVLRESADLDGRREEREDALEALALVAGTLVEEAFNPQESEPPAPLPLDRRDLTSDAHPRNREAS